MILRGFGQDVFGQVVVTVELDFRFGPDFFRVFSGFPSVDPADCSSAHGWKSSRRLRAR